MKMNTSDVKVKIYLLFLMPQKHIGDLSRCFTDPAIYKS